jgi:hypothetical protein
MLGSSICARAIDDAQAKMMKEPHSSDRPDADVYMSKTPSDNVFSTQERCLAQSVSPSCAGGNCHDTRALLLPVGAIDWRGFEVQQKLP